MTTKVRKTVTLNCDPARKMVAGHLARYWQLGTKGLEPRKYREVTLVRGQVVAVAECYDGHCTLKLQNGDAVTLEGAKELVAPLLA